MSHTDPDRGRALHDDDRETDSFDWEEVGRGRLVRGDGPAAGLPGPDASRSRRRLSRRIRRVVALVTLLAVLVVAFGVYRIVDQALFGGNEDPPGAFVTVRIPRGTSVGG